MTDDMWRTLVNSYEGLDGKIGPPSIEAITPVVDSNAFAPDGDDDEGMLFVQKIVTEVYIYTDSKQQVFGEHTFQDMVILGNMSKDKLTKLLNRQKRKHEKGS